ncbi:hypothetical protein [Galactobacter caseinivorans]|uniref:Uncharacterized protein n=1 Tax=Galactobacter caseinivorans TaxID=2676123 RepID=A0A496PH94_9MICC|nr:hypothetical protein [Galactobacter caseinivorans]RKW69839.1 hypothetical protein DWQ67_10165 [Galactobacter caseinivorans]
MNTRKQQANAFFATLNQATQAEETFNTIREQRANQPPEPTTHTYTEQDQAQHHEDMLQASLSVFDNLGKRGPNDLWH